MNGMNKESVGGLLKEGDLYPCYDANGNITQKLNRSGETVMNVAYDPFGNVISGALTGEYGFSTKPLVDGVDWYYYGFRYYDPVTGRWPSRDPMVERGGLSLYAMTDNDLINFIDLMGYVKVGSKTKKLVNTEIFNSEVNVLGPTGIMFLSGPNQDYDCKCDDPEKLYRGTSSDIALVVGGTVTMIFDLKTTLFYEPIPGDRFRFRIRTTLLNNSKYDIWSQPKRTDGGTYDVCVDPADIDQDHGFYFSSSTSVEGVINKTWAGDQKLEILNNVEKVFEHIDQFKDLQDQIKSTGDKLKNNE